MNASHPPAHIPLVLTRRGGHIENVYFGSYAVVDSKGVLIEQAGDAQTPVFTRSSLKPFQALPLVAHPRFGALQLSNEELALLCASHNGETRHADRAQALLSRVGADASALQCGVHTPYWYAHNNKPVPTNQSWGTLHHNCSGKHSGFVILSHLLNNDPRAYLTPDAAVQLQVRAAVAYAAGYGDAVTSMPWGIDGCSAPNFALPLERLARAYGWLSDPSADPRYGESRVKIFDAMASCPEMVSGEGRHDLDLTRAGQGAWVNKVGAEGVQTLASRTHGLAIALKISDGNPVALMVGFCAVMQKLGLLDDHARTILKRWSSPMLTSIRGEVVGQWEPIIC